MKYINSAIFLIAILVVSNAAVFAQESEAKVVDEVVAQVNDSVVTLSQIKREMNEAIDSFVKEGKTPEQAKAEIEGKQGELIASLINEELILQKGKELNGVEADVEAQINARFLEIMKQQNIKSLDALYKAMEASGVEPQGVREVWRKQITKDIVLQREVDSKVFFGLTPKEVKSYYEANKAKFTKPETISISEIFLGFAGRDEAAVREKAKQLLVKLRSGADFAALAVENSDRPNVKENKGKAGTLNVKDLDKVFAEPLKNVKVGGISELIEMTEGIEILRVDARTNASSESFFDENEVRKVMAYEKLPVERKKYMTTLREDAYIRISESYRPMVLPILFADDRKTEVKKSDK
ncbi:MAG: peptidyl-prolyl cis-trans isomerase [Acidobacteriota bacterium]|nr:peptidyl-prolyl cis-trans isomerase [Acidobacteriota bacterium]